MGWIRSAPQEASHTDGYSVGPSDRFHVEYVEGGRRALVDAEFGGPTVALYAKTLHWEDDAGLALRAEERATILGRIADGLRVIDATPEIIA